MDSTDCGSASDHQPPKQITDLPDEVISQICELLIPQRSSPKPFKSSEIKSSRRTLKVGGWDKFGFISGNEACTHRYVTSRFFGVEVSGRSGRADFGVLTQPYRARKKTKNNLANFAATCRRFSTQGQTMYARRTFTMTISNHGITFESLRDAFPLQTFSVLPKDQGSIQPSWAMVDPASRTVVKIPKNTIPGNVAFGRFSAVFESLRTLHLCIDIDLEKGQNKKTAFFLGQLGRFLLSHPHGIALSTLEVDVHLGFHEFTRDDVRRPSSGPVYLIPESLRFTSHPASAQATTIAKAAVAEVSNTLATFSTYLQQLRAKHNNGSGTNGIESGTERVKVKLSIHGDGTDGMEWGTDVVVGMVWQSAAGFNWSWRPRKAPFGNFESFCKELQLRLYGSNRTEENKVVDNVHFVCELGLPLPKISKAAVKKRPKGRRETRSDSGSTGDVEVRDSKRRRLG